MARKVKFALLERVVNGRVVWRHPRVWRIAEARHYAKVAATQGEQYNVVLCSLDPETVDSPTAAISFSSRSS